jgi:hypothetical protein
MTHAEPLYDYKTEAKATPAQVQQTWTKGALMRRYVELNPPGSLGINETAEDVLLAGQAIAEG